MCRKPPRLCCAITTTRQGRIGTRAPGLARERTATSASASLLLILCCASRAGLCAQAPSALAPFNLLHTHVTHLAGCRSNLPHANIQVVADPDDDGNLLADEDGSVFVAQGGQLFKYTGRLDLVDSAPANGSQWPRREHANRLLALVETGPGRANGTRARHLLSCWRDVRDLNLTCALSWPTDLKSLAPLRWQHQSSARTAPSAPLGLSLDASEQVRLLDLGPSPGGGGGGRRAPSEALPGSDQGNLLLLASRPLANRSQLERAFSFSGAPEGGPLRTFGLPALARFELSVNSSTLKLNALLPYRIELFSYYPLYDYMYAFKHESYTFFVLNDIQHHVPSPHTGYTVRLARVCTDDTTLSSYTELLLTCRNQSDDLYAMAAHFEAETPMGPSSNASAAPRRPGTLDIVFQRKFRGSNGMISSSQTGYWRRPWGRGYRSWRIVPLSYLCSYSIDLIQAKFDATVRACHAGATRATLLAKLHAGPAGESLECRQNLALRPPRSPPTQQQQQQQKQEQEQEQEQEFCSSSMNAYIDGDGLRNDLAEERALELRDLAGANYLLSFTSSRDASQRVHFVGTESGLLTKLTSAGVALYTVDVYEMRIMNYPQRNRSLVPAPTYFNESLARPPDTKYAFARGNLTALGRATAGRRAYLQQVPIGSCSLYTTHETCAAGAYPAKCHWCPGDVCSSSCELDKRAKHCSDLIHKLGEELWKSNPELSEAGRALSLWDFMSALNIFLLVCLLAPLLLFAIYLTRYDGARRIKRRLGPRPHSRPLDYAKTATTTMTKTHCDASSASDSSTQEAASASSQLLAADGAPRDTSAPASGGSTSSSTGVGGGGPALAIAPLGGGLIVTFDGPREPPAEDELLLELAQANILIEGARLKLGHFLGSGKFGRVHKGYLFASAACDQYQEVAVKTLRIKSNWDDELARRALVREGLIMRNLSHENVLSLLGVALDPDGLPMLITPFMRHGDLHSYVSENDASQVPFSELVQFGLQIARGMAYVSQRKVLHRDLAARNCMLDEGRIAKVADFGLSRDIYGRDFYAPENPSEMPVKWLALESLKDEIYTSKSDVWSFGVLLWELATRGATPYPDVRRYDIMRDHLSRGRRLLCPAECPESLYTIMRACWRATPELRPDFCELEASLAQVRAQLESVPASSAAAGSESAGEDELTSDE